MNSDRDRDFEAALARTLGLRLTTPARLVSSGSINRTQRYETDCGPIFIKAGAPHAYEMFAAEAAGLAAIAATKTLRTPRVFGVGAWEGGAFIALEWLEMSTRSAASEARLGELLAQQHRTTQAAFGWERDNTIGATPQSNTRSDDWLAFFRDRRLAFQLSLAERNGAPARLLRSGERVCDSVGAALAEHRPAPSLLHGDLWSGNWGATFAGEPVVFDPAVYFGDREADLAMTHLFGGFGAAFYAAYEAAWPLPQGFEQRRTLYNLYHVLNHFNLFGGAYLAQAQAMIDRLLAG